MKRSRMLVLAGGAAALALAAAACSSPTTGGTGGAGGYYAAGAPAAAADPAVPVAEISSAALGPGTALVDGTGRAMYLFENDSTSASTCAGACASVWPPVPAPAGSSSAGNAALGNIPRPDGGAQLTYDGHPLYYYVGDQNPGDSRGQGLNQFGAHWYLVQPNGTELGKD